MFILFILCFKGFRVVIFKFVRCVTVKFSPFLNFNIWPIFKSAKWLMKKLNSKTEKSFFFVKSGPGFLCSSHSNGIKQKFQWWNKITHVRNLIFFSKNRKKNFSHNPFHPKINILVDERVQPSSKVYYWLFARPLSIFSWAYWFAEAAVVFIQIPYTL